MRSQSADSALSIYAGPAARALIQAHGLQAADVSAVAAAAGGPKGLSLLPLDRFLFGQWLANQKPAFVSQRQLFGASIGAWRMAAASRRHCLAYLDRLQQAYVERQCYPQNPSREQVSQICRAVVDHMVAEPAAFLADCHSDYALQVITSRTTAPSNVKSFFTKAALLNCVGRRHLALLMQRHVFKQGLAATDLYDDVFSTQTHDLTVSNVSDALLASGSIPLVANPVQGVTDANANALSGALWDGALIDYHLYVQFNQLPGLVLYPHFTGQVTAGWLDKFLPWRRHGVGYRGRHWFDNVLLVAPSRAFIASLPQQKIPDRKDFYAFGLRHEERIAQWHKQINRCTELATAFEEFIEHPGRFTIAPLPH
jgi:hypothetical protein